MLSPCHTCQLKFITFFHHCMRDNLDYIWLDYGKTLNGVTKIESAEHTIQIQTFTELLE